MRRLHPLKDDAGFTIVEVLMASVVLLVGILGVATMVNTANSTTTSNKSREQGLALARELLESARSVKYQTLRPSTVVSTLQSMPGFADASSADPGWTIRRRGITFTVSVGVCSVDDAGDKTGAHIANTFCANPVVQADAATCKGLIGTPAKINGTGGGGASAGDCGLDTNLDGQVDGLVQSSASSCPTGTSVATNTCDAQPDDFKRLVTLVTWDRGDGNRYVLQQATEPFPGLSAYGGITSLTLDSSSGCCYSSTSNGYVVSFPGSGNAPSKLKFVATSDQPANQVNWLLGGVDQGPTNWSGSSGDFEWNIGTADGNATAPVTGEILDGGYLVGARVQDGSGIHGDELVVPVVLNRRIPFRPLNFSIEGSDLDAQGRPTKVIAKWDAPADRDLVGYRLKWKLTSNTTGSYSTVTSCALIDKNVRSCKDTGPPVGVNITYAVVALDTDPTGAVREGQASESKTIDVGNIPPTTPTITDVKKTGEGAGTSNVQVWWSASTDPDDPVERYELWRSGCGSPTTAAKVAETATNSAALTVSDSTAPKKASCVYTVRAKDTGGTFSNFSDPVTVAT